jgi:hypothetical protein
MSYNEFLDYRAKNGKPMELQLWLKINDLLLKENL